jgi:hypothetical protein
MLHMRATRIAAIALAAAMAACSGSDPAGPELSQFLRPDSASGGSSDTTRVSPASVDVSGQVLGVKRAALGAVVVGDSSVTSYEFEPIAGARVAIVRNVLVDGEARQELVAETRSGRNGEFAFQRVPPGYYLLTANAPADSRYADNFTYLAANVAVIRS